MNRDNTESIPSLQMWHRYFHGKGKLTGFDIDQGFSKLHDPTREIHIKISDQSSPCDLQQLISDKQYDIIIDDGYHSSKCHQVSFNNIRAVVKGGGFYIIENLHWQPQIESCRRTKTLKRWCNGNYFDIEFITVVFLYDSHSPFYNPDKLKGALAVIKKKK